MFLVCLWVTWLGWPVGSDSALAATVEELREELTQKKAQLKSAEDRINKFKEEIQLKKKKARTLSDQIELIDESINEIELSVSRTELEIEKTGIEVETVNEEIEQRQAEMEIQKKRLAAYLRNMHELDQESMVTVFLKYESFAEAVQEAGTLKELQTRGQETLVSIQQLKEELTTKKRELEDFQQTLEALKTRQKQQQKTLAAERSSKERILDLTNQQEEKYQALLRSAQRTHEEATSDINSLDALIREELKKQGIGKLPSVGVFDWPINATFGISCEYHCTDYPYAYLIGPHSGMDIPAYVGTPIKAPADGYVARAHDSGGTGYSYIMLIYGDNISTVFGHVSGFAVNEGEMVSRGTVIGYTGGAPGMHGAGLSTGPHLHFEVRVNGQTTNPRNYL